ncbi:type III-B CRISPR module RAMP protein Cmr6 [Candidatus Poribacteria bacterium]|nr:type III-B CRISPR module RAMP protein Cmr6 [Candidatus Poribacteria bacterium]
MQIYCPSDTRDIVTHAEVSNFALRYHHFLVTRSDREKTTFGLQAKQPNQTLSLAGSQKVLEPLRDRQTDQLRYFASNGYFYCATSRIDWRMVVGLGGNHVQETNMTLHHVYGIPYLPGSALKGVVRSWVIQEYFGNDEKLATRDIEARDPADLKQKKKNFVDVFGSQKSAGMVQFFDALPNSGVHFDVDIMNPHFSDYYTRGAFPTDYQRLIQIYFLTLKNTHFRFLIVAKETGPLQLVTDWFTEAIANQGFGAKSAVGYGYFSELNDITDELKYEFAEKLSLDQAYNIYHNDSNRWESIYIDIEPLVSYAPKFAIILIEKICEVESIGGINEIPEILIETEAGIVVPSEFGKWVWEKTKDKLFEEELPAFPNLVYRAQFRRTLRNSTVEQRKLLQEELLQIAIDFRRTLNRSLSDDDRELLQEQLLQVADNLENGNMFAGLTQDERNLFAGKLWNIAEDLENEGVVPDAVDVEGGRTIECGGIENGKLVLRTYTNQ